MIVSSKLEGSEDENLSKEDKMFFLTQEKKGKGREVFVSHNQVRK